MDENSFKLEITKTGGHSKQRELDFQRDSIKLEDPAMSKALLEGRQEPSQVVAGKMALVK